MDPDRDEGFSIHKTESEWREALTEDQYRVLRQRGTEPAFTGRYWKTRAQGSYHCAGCGKPLYRSEAKYDSGSGWPSFREAVSPDAITTDEDHSLGMDRTELRCAECGGHLGHLFPDGPAPTGLRHCVNSAALLFEPDADEEAT